MSIKADCEVYRRRLAAWSRRLRGDIVDLEEEALRGVGAEPSGGLSNVPLHPADLAASASEETVALGLLGNEEHMLAEVDAALTRLDAGTFGRCEKCCQPIPRRRLEAAPYVRYCIDCEKERETGRPTGTPSP
jgi:RNA polymerase-binding transcription factor DksA